MIIDGSDLIVGRVATVAAKKALEGEQVVILNCEHMIVTGKKNSLLEKFRLKRKRGDTLHGPFFPKAPDRIVKRSIRGMLDYKNKRGSDAFKRIKVYIGVPVQFHDKTMISLEQAHKKKLKTLDYVTVKRISEFLGSRVQ